MFDQVKKVVNIYCVVVLVLASCIGFFFIFVEYFEFFQYFVYVQGLFYKVVQCFGRNLFVEGC